MTSELILMMSFVSATSAILLVLWAMNRPDHRAEERLNQLKNDNPNPLTSARKGRNARQTRRSLKPSAFLSLDIPEARLRRSLHEAGLYHPLLPTAIVTARSILLLVPWLIMAVLLMTGSLSLWKGALLVAALNALSTLSIPYWLKYRKMRRQTEIRTSLSDFLDILNICLEGGLSLPAALKEVSMEIRTAHPILGTELAIVQWEAQMGEPVAEAFLRFGERTGVEEVRRLAAVFRQNTQYGTGLISSLKTYAETLRYRQIQQTEERAQKSATKILFPTLICIFPGIFLILLGPAALQLSDVMGKLNPNVVESTVQGKTK
ncbi:MAG: type II secretion system F family protein [Bdellovibrionales bacterium]